jgi:ectoine hydroxylase-related dioxygenase (phytanoyl-CoA dioxygenase family)
VLSLPGTEVQYWHSDGVHVGDSSTLDDSDAAAPVHALCVFCPLIDLNEETGYTEFWAGSHKYSKLLAKKGEQALPGGTKGILNKGNFLVYDYRTIHRGMPNTSARARPVCYFLYTRAGFEFVEDQNFTEQSVFGDC